MLGLLLFQFIQRFPSFCCLNIFSAVVGLSFLPLVTSSLGHAQAPSSVYTELKSLKKEAKVLQEKISRLCDKEGSKNTPKQQNWSLKISQQIDKFGHYLQYRFYTFFTGLQHISQLMIKGPCPHPFLYQKLTISACHIIIGIACCVLSRYIGFRLPPSFLGTTSISIHRISYKLTSFFRFLLVPVLPIILVCILTEHTLLPWLGQDNLLENLTIIPWFPLVLYVLWGMRTLQNTLNNKAQNNLVKYFSLSLAGSFAGLLWAELWQWGDAAIKALTDLCVLLFVFVFLRYSQAVLQQPSWMTSRTWERAKNTCKTFGLLWFFGKKLILYILFPVFFTFYSFCTYAYLRKASSKIHKIFITNFILRNIRPIKFLFSVKNIRNFFRYSLFILNVYVWIPYAWIGEYDIGSLTAEFIESFLTSPWFTGFFNGAIVLSLAFVVTKIADRILRYYVEEKYAADSQENNFLASRLRTLMTMLKTIIRIIIWTPSVSIVISVVLSQFGESINFSPWISGIGVAGLGLTFGVQNIVRDFITGFFIILENNLVVGDEVDIDGKAGKVETISLRTLKIRADTGMLLTIPFSAISVIGNKNRDFSATVMNISVAYGENIDRIQELVEKAFALTRKSPFFNRRILGPLEIRGVTEVTHYSVVFQIKIKTMPNAQDNIRRAFTRHLKNLFDEAGILVPTPPHAVYKTSPSLTQTVI